MYIVKLYTIYTILFILWKPFSLISQHLIIITDREAVCRYFFDELWSFLVILNVNRITLSRKDHAYVFISFFLLLSHIHLWGRMISRIEQLDYPASCLVLPPLYFALKSSKEHITFPLITKFETNRSLSYLSVNRIPN